MWATSSHVPSESLREVPHAELTLCNCVVLRSRDGGVTRESTARALAEFDHRTTLCSIFAVNPKLGSSSIDVRQFATWSGEFRFK
jgi:hypothetical protein